MRGKSAQKGSRTLTSIGHTALNRACLPIPASGQYKQKRLKLMSPFSFKSDLAGARTLDPLLKREMLYQLSYQINLFFALLRSFSLIAVAKVKSLN